MKQEPMKKARRGPFDTGTTVSMHTHRVKALREGGA